LLNPEAARRRQTISVHIEVDTGMGRTGVDPDQVEELLRACQGEYVRLEGIYTHFPVADRDLSFTRGQLAEFGRLTARLRQQGLKFIQHAANSSGLLNVTESALDMVRPGLAIYGILPNGCRDHLRTCLPLRPVMTLRSRIVNLRQFPPGRSVSYERSFITTRDSRIAVISAGYGDGYPRGLSNRGMVLVRGRRAPIVGTVCMDLTMIDVTECEDVSIGDVVTLLGQDGDDCLTANELANWAGTIPYEITCRISPRVPRVFRSGGKIMGIRNRLT
ncbi:MAG: alanine racemase, partial [candidate division WOR-3 bacterium]